MLKKPYVDFRSLKEAHSPQYANFWKQQEQIKAINDQERLKREQQNISELDRYKADVLETARQEARAYERSHGNSGSFFKDMKWGMKYGNNSFIKPFKKYADPVLSKLGPVGNSVSSISGNISGVVDKL
jgi:hypothetical protein